MDDEESILQRGGQPVAKKLRREAHDNPGGDMNELRDRDIISEGDRITPGDETEEDGAQSEGIEDEDDEDEHEERFEEEEAMEDPKEGEGDDEALDNGEDSE